MKMKKRFCYREDQISCALNVDNYVVMRWLITGRIRTLKNKSIEFDFCVTHVQFLNFLKANPYYLKKMKKLCKGSWADLGMLQGTAHREQIKSDLNKLFASIA